MRGSGHGEEMFSRFAGGAALARHKYILHEYGFNAVEDGRVEGGGGSRWAIGSYRLR